MDFYSVYNHLFKLSVKMLSDIQMPFWEENSIFSRQNREESQMKLNPLEAQMLLEKIN